MSGNSPGLKDVLIILYTNIICTNYIDIDEIHDKIIEPSFSSKRNLPLSQILNDIIMLSSPDSIILKTRTQPDRIETAEFKPLMIENDSLFHCICIGDKTDSSPSSFLVKMKNYNAIIMPNKVNYKLNKYINQFVSRLIQLLNDEALDIKCFVIRSLPNIVQYTNCGLKEPYLSSWLSCLSSRDLEVISIISDFITDLFDKINTRIDANDEKIKTEFNVRVLKEFAKAINFGMTADSDYQSTVLNMLVGFTASKIVNEDDVLDCFRFAIKFMMTSTSKVSRQAFLDVEQICKNINLKPVQFLNLYKQGNFKFIMEQVAGNYVSRNVKMTETIKMLCKVFGFSSVRDFVVKYYKIMIAAMLPILIKVSKACF